MNYRQIIEQTKVFGMPARRMIVVDLFNVLPKHEQLNVIYDIIQTLNDENQINDKAIKSISESFSIDSFNDRS